ncbi:hypothetical protein DC3_02260 [Deinococcus cellulosilyticus NBRC 106333 = KACC 11606]|uniref:DUF4384 domain-containing protein n=2 Tax=Deinococcus cellulosilyticus TaxID=401558 RepID=A0A511MW12_DEIC1|nr:hypothetical protein DC3_02260 [Deinococcus cellulosilyticus NBRC 106333 = KACC 11606]
MLLLFSLLTASGALTANAAPMVNSQGVIVNPYQTNLQAQLWLDRDGSMPEYATGETIRFFAQLNDDAYVYLFNVDSYGRVDLILPNRFSAGEQFVRGGYQVSFPDQNDGFEFEVAPPRGLNQVILLASKTPLDFDRVADFRFGNTYRTAFADSENEFVDKMSIVLGDVWDEDWVTDTVFYNAY